MPLTETIILRLEINIFSLIVLGILWLSGNRRRTSKAGSDQRIFRMLLASTAIMLATDAVSWYLDGSRDPAARILLYAALTLYYAFHSIPTVYFIRYVDLQVSGDAEPPRPFPRFFYLAPLAIAVASAVSPFTGFLFTLDEDGRYARGYGFYIFAILQYGFVLYSFAIVIRKRAKLRRRVFYTLLAYPLPMLAAAFIQMFVFGLVLIWPSLTLFLIAAAANIDNRRSRLDHLTGTANRRSLDEELENRIAAARPGWNLHGLLMDVDDFKSINDKFGHDTGDRALEDVGSMLMSSVRVEDMVARMGGDEFVVLFDSEDRSALEEMVKRIEAALEKHNATAGRPYRLSLSIGRGSFDRESDKDAPDFLARLDADMYQRKRRKKGIPA